VKRCTVQPKSSEDRHYTEPTHVPSWPIASSSSLRSSKWKFYTTVTTYNPPRLHCNPCTASIIPCAIASAKLHKIHNVVQTANTRIKHFTSWPDETPERLTAIISHPLMAFRVQLITKEQTEISKSPILNI